MDGRPVSGTPIGPDLALLSGSFDAPYARPGALSAHGDLVVEGFGCEPWRPSRRPAHSPHSAAFYGAEIGFDGRVCHGDSGGALWQNGRLVGIVTAVCEAGCETPTGYATAVLPSLRFLPVAPQAAE